MSVFFKELIKNLGSFSIAAGCITYLLKKFLDLYLTKKVDDYKIELQKLSLEHQVKFSKLHEERAEIIKIIYCKLNDLHKKMRILTTIFQGPDWTKDTERAQEATNSYQDFFSFYENNKIFFNKSLCSLIEKISDDYLKAASKFGTAKATNDISPDGRSLWMEAEKQVREDILKVREKLEDEFRNLLGVS